MSMMFVYDAYFKNLNYKQRVCIQMQRSNNSSKKATIPMESQPEQYRSEMSKASNVNKGKQKFSVQNIKDFKYEIDHEIAKCLDTLDRQGLKFLKQTLRASKIFGLNTQELGNTQPIEENLQFQSEQLEVKQKSPPKKTNTKNIVVKKVTKAEPQKKPATAQKNTRNDSKTNLGENIHKKLEAMNIKTSKKQQGKTVEPIKKEDSEKVKRIEPKSNNEIAQEIQVQEAPQQTEVLVNNASIKIQQSIKSQQISDSPKKAYEKIPQKEVNLVRQSEKVKDSFDQKSASTTKPFCKKQFKKPHHVEGNKHINKDYGIEISKEEDIRQLINNETEKESKTNIQTIINQSNYQSQKIKQKTQQRQLEVSVQPSLNIQKTQENVEKQQKGLEPQMLSLIAKINKLSPTKRGKLERILQKLQQNPLIQTSMLSMGSSSSKNEVSYMKPYVPQKNSFFKQSNASEKSKSRSKLQKIQKASSIKGSIVKRMNQEELANSPEPFEKKNSQSRIQQSFQRQAVQQPVKQVCLKNQEKVQSKKQIFKFSKKNQEQSIKSLKNSLNFIQKDELVSPSMIQSGQKLIKIGKKKNQPSNVTLKILSNNGHPTLVSLSNILLYNQSGDIIQIDDSNIKQSNQKIVKLFTLNSDSWTTQLSNANISVQNILQPIGGIRIVNFNKSELENNKQADLAELFINQQLQWRGQLKGGSFKEGEQYITDIKISSKDFVFPNANNNSMTKSKLFPQQKIMRQSLIDLKEKKAKDKVDWLQKQSVYEKMREIEESEKNQSVTKKIQSIRNTMSSVPQSKVTFENKLVLQTQNKRTQEKPEIVISKNVSRLRPVQQKGFSLQSINSPKDKPSKVVIKESQDILGQLSKSIGTKKKTNPKEQPIAFQKQNKKEEYLIMKEKQQDDEFQKILKSLEQREKENELGDKNFQKEVKNTNQRVQKEQFVKQNKGKAVVQKSLEQFMKDSLFDDMPKQKKYQTNTKNNVNLKNLIKPIQKTEYSEPNRNFKKNNNNNLDDLIDELNDVVGNQNVDETGEEFTIPELPKGKQLLFLILSNWGNQHFSGLNGIEIFDTNGDTVRPSSITSSSVSSQQILDKLCKSEFLTSDEQMQLKLPKSKKSILAFTFQYKIEIAAIRIWNYNGHRVHSNIGVKKCHMKLDNSFIFSGEIQQSTGSSEDAYKYCQYVLFTQNNHILKKISDKDWLNKKRNNFQSERMLFKSTLQNFHRPQTRNEEQNVKKQLKTVQMKKQMIKLPKRMCFQYDPPQLPEGFTLKFILHSSWGDHFFIGLNGIQIFNQKGQNITKQNLNQINADPSSISRLPGYERDKRVVNNLINGKNNTTSDSDIWLTPLLSDVEKIEKGRSNFIVMQYNKLIKIAGINLYNYTKTPERGVRQIEVYLDKCLLYRGYLRKYNEQEGIIHTTINFTKQQALLEAMNYVGYNEDHLEQEVGLINEGKILKQSNTAANSQQNLIRPMTGKLVS